MSEEKMKVCGNCYIEWSPEEMTGNLCDLCHEMWEHGNQE